MLVLVLMIVPVLGLTDDYIPLTKEEMNTWLFTITYDELLELVIKHDYIEHSVPRVTQPEAFVILDRKNDLYLSYPSLMTIKIGYLEYNFRFETQVIEDFVPKKQTRRKTALLIGGGFISGALLSIILLR